MAPRRTRLTNDSHSGREGPAAPKSRPLRIIVRIGALRRFDALTRKTVDLPVDVSWDRRRGERRTSPDGAGNNRRASERRQAPPFTWELADFVVVEEAGE
jgi:hypothetical protein